MKMNRRKFGSSLITIGAAASLPKIKMEDETYKRIVRPNHLKKGDLIGVIGPAGVLTDKKIQKSVSKFEQYGFRVKLGKHIGKKYGYLAGTDTERLEDLHDMYSDKNVKGIWCARGGYGITRILDSIDFSLIRKNPKVLIGFSDITALLNAIYHKTKIVGFHGPMGASKHNDLSSSMLLELITNPEYNYRLAPLSEEILDVDAQKILSLRSGLATGIAVGGNLTLLAAMAGTPYLPRFKNRIVFLEDIGEEPYRIDRMLTQLISATDFAQAKGFVVGQFSGCDPSSPETSLSLLEVLKDRLVPLQVPTITGINFGHVKYNMPFPVGGKLKVDFETGVIKLVDKVVQ